MTAPRKETTPPERWAVHLSKNREYGRTFRTRHPGYMTDYCFRWKQEHPDRVALHHCRHYRKSGKTIQARRYCHRARALGVDPREWGGET